MTDHIKKIAEEAGFYEPELMEPLARFAALVAEDIRNLMVEIQDEFLTEVYIEAIRARYGKGE